jgi:predicted Zn-dependent protease
MVDKASEIKNRTEALLVIAEAYNLDAPQNDLKKILKFRDDRMERDYERITAILSGIEKEIRLLKGKA